VFPGSGEINRSRPLSIFDPLFFSLACWWSWVLQVCLIMCRPIFHARDKNSENCTRKSLCRKKFSLPCIPCSVVGIATPYNLDGPSVDLRWRQNPSRPTMGPVQPPPMCKWLLPAGKTVGAWHWAPTPSGPKARRDQSYTSAPVCAFMTRHRENFTFLYPFLHKLSTVFKKNECF
jgi:hypothetical protein